MPKLPTSAAALFESELDAIREAGLYKDERVITSQQDAEIEVASGQEVINFCANNYLGLANHPELIEAVKEGADRYGFGLASVRFICGTQDIHKELEHRIADFFETEATILYGSCFDANTGLFETLLDADCAIISDQLNHASIIDGIRLCKASRHRYPHSNMDELERILQETQGAKIRMIATDGVFSMDGDVARLDQICDLAEQYDAMVMVDDCHGTGFLGEHGRGSLEYCGVLGRVDVITSTLGKALGGATGGFTTGRGDVVELLRQRSRPYLFSNAVAPPLVYASLRVLEMIGEADDLRRQVMDNTQYFRKEMSERGFDIKPGDHPIVPIMLYDAKKAQQVADAMLEEGIYVIAFSYPVVPQGEARIRVQMSAAHEREHLDRAIDAFTRIGERFSVI